MTDFRKVRNKVKQLAFTTQNDHTIFPFGNGYRVSNRFTIVSGSIGWVVVDDRNDKKTEFVSVKNALAYCMALNADNRDLANELNELDQKYHRKQFDVQNKIYLLSGNAVDPETRAVLVIKLDEDIKLSKRLKIELQKRLNRAKYIKVKGSHYEFTGIDENGQ